MERIAEQEPMIRRAMTVEDIFTKNDEERRLYELREKGQRSYENAMLTSERRGRLEGRMEGKLEIAHSMLADGMSADIISKFTGLTIEEIKALS